VRRLRIPAVGLLAACGLSLFAHAVEIVRWERLPISLMLHVGQERIVFVDRPVRVAIPESIAAHLRIQSADGAVYLRAERPVGVTRLELQDPDSGALVLLDVKATPGAPDEPALEPVRILLSQHIPAELESKSAADTHREPAEPALTSTPTAVLLTRYAAQSLYAPLRTVGPVSGITPVPIRKNQDFTTLLPGLTLRITPLATWRLEDEWVTALRITHAASGWVSLDPRALQGDFVAATFQHPDVGPQGDSTDTTVLYLVTREHSLTESLVPAISPVDASANLPHPAPMSRHP